MIQYCRYCSHMYCGNGNYCEVNEVCFSDSIIKHTNKCRCFDFLPIDALGENEKGYRPRKGHYIVEKRVDELNRIPSAELPERCVAKITLDEDKYKEIVDEAIREVVVRCTECRHRRLCDQCTEQNGKMYHIEWCSRGEREE